jgi:hypothetical protein
MHRSIKILLALPLVWLLNGCSGTVGGDPPNVTVNITNSFTSIPAGSRPVTLNVTIANQHHNDGVRWSLSLANTGCSPECGTLTPSQSPSYSAVYKPPAEQPVNQTAVITATSVEDPKQIFVFSFTITAAISVVITPKFSAQYAGGAPVSLSAQVTNDPFNAGVTWALTANGSNCSPACGTLTSGAAPSFSATYTPPSNAPTGANAKPTITAASVTDPTQSDSFSFSFPISVTIAPKFTVQLVEAAPVTLTAQVLDDLAGAGVTWTLTAGGASCSPACGTLTSSAAPSFSATYTPPSNQPSGADVSPTITATSVTDSTKSDSFTFTIKFLPLTVTITTSFTAQFVAGPPTAVVAQVINDPANAGVSWTLTANGVSCSPDCGTITSPQGPTLTATYLPPPSLPTTAGDSTPTITAVSVTNPKKSASFTFTISSANSQFLGDFAFLLRGYDVGGSPMSVAGSVTSDGNGNITAGEIDFNNGGGITHVPGAIGTYTLAPLFNGTLHGAFTISNFTFPNAKGPLPITFKFVLSADGKRGKVVELDGLGFRNSGTILAQDAAAIAAANPAGSYAFQLDSDSPFGGRSVAAGQMIIAGTSVTGIIDESKAGDLSPRYTDAAITSASFTAPDLSGRGTMSLTVTGVSPTPSVTRQYAYYVVNASQLNLIEIANDTTFGTVQAGIARLQKPLTASSVNTTSVLQMTGLDSTYTATHTAVYGPDVIIGVMNITTAATGEITFGLNFDENDLGNFISKQPDPNTGAPAENGQIVFDPNTGRGVLSDGPSVVAGQPTCGGFSAGFVNSAVFYLYDVGRGFIIDTDISTPTVPNLACPMTNNAFSGTLTPQAAGPFTNASVLGNLLAEFGASASPTVPNAALTFNVDSTGGYMAGGDVTTLDTQGGNLPDVSFTGNSGNVSIGGGGDPTQQALGRGILSVPPGLFGDFNPADQKFPFPVLLYVINQNEFVGIGFNSGTPSGVMFFDPQ